MTELINIDAAIGHEELQASIRKVAAEAIEGMTKDTPVTEIEPALSKLADVPESIREELLALAKKNTGKPLKTLRNCIRKRNHGRTKFHTELAGIVVNSIGKDNIIFAQSAFWIWDSSGVWRMAEPEEPRTWILKCEINFDGILTGGIASSVEGFIRAMTLKANHSFNQGNSETVNCLNGELEFITDEWMLQPHNRENFRTTQIPIVYDPEAKAPRFEQFLDEIFLDDADAKDKKRIVLELMGYSLMAHCRYEKFVILVGKGANGKSVLLKVIESLCGSANTAGVQPAHFDRTFQRAHLHNKLVNIVTEIKEGEVIADAELKGIVSGETSTVEHKFKQPFEMRPFATCWFGTNHMPHTRDFSDALSRRAVVLTFNQVFKPELGNCDATLIEKLEGESSGILNLALKAYARVITTGRFSIPESSINAVKTWRMESDQAAQFVEDCCEAVPGHDTPVKELYESYREWADENGTRQLLTKRRFADRLEGLGYKRTRTAAARVVCGLALVHTLALTYKKRSNGE